MGKKTYLYISSWRKSSSYFGISGYEFLPESGELIFIENVESKVSFNVTFYEKNRRILYALEESSDLPNLRGGGGGRVFVFKIDPNTGALTKIGCTETWCSNPSYLTLDNSGKYMIVSHHGGNSAVTKIAEDGAGNYSLVVERDDVAVELFSVNEDGTLGRLLDVNKHYGCGPEKRQAHACPHSAVMSPSGKLFAVCDKGNDTVSMYMLDEDQKKLIRPKYVYHHIKGTLPRHCVFHPNKPWFYNNSENTPNISGFSYTERGLLQENGIYSAVPENFQMKEENFEQQGLVIDSFGHFIYDIVRGPNIVTVFSVNQNDGTLTPVQHQAIPGKWPRGCAISPDGRFFVVCCLDSEDLIVYAIAEDGRLSEISSCVNPAAAYAIFCEIRI